MRQVRKGTEESPTTTYRNMTRTTSRWTNHAMQCSLRDAQSVAAKRERERAQGICAVERNFHGRDVIEDVP